MRVRHAFKTHREYWREAWMAEKMGFLERFGLM